MHIQVQVMVHHGFGKKIFFWLDFSIIRLSPACRLDTGSVVGVEGGEWEGSMAMPVTSPQSLSPCSSLASFSPGSWDVSLEHSLCSFSQSHPCLVFVLRDAGCPRLRGLSHFLSVEGKRGRAHPMEENQLCFNLPPELHYLPQQCQCHHCVGILSLLMGSLNLPLEVDKNKVNTLQSLFPAHGRHH